MVDKTKMFYFLLYYKYHNIFEYVLYKPHYPFGLRELVYVFLYLLYAVQNILDLNYQVFLILLNQQIYSQKIKDDEERFENFIQSKILSIFHEAFTAEQKIYK